MNIVENACELAYKYHDGQMYGDKPYVHHLSDVVQSLYTKYTEYRDPVLIATAWLHDILEDTKCTSQEIVNLCGADVFLNVDLLTKRKGQSYEEYLRKVQTHKVSLEVKLHDSLCNLTASVMSGEKGRIKKYARQLQLLVGE